MSIYSIRFEESKQVCFYLTTILQQRTYKKHDWQAALSPPPPGPFFLLRETNFRSQTHNLSFLVVELAIAPRPDPCPKNLQGERGGNKGFSRVLTKSIFLDSSHQFTPSIGVILSGIFYGLGMKASSVFLLSILLTTKEMNKSNEEFC